MIAVDSWFTGFSGLIIFLLVAWAAWTVIKRNR